MKSYDLVIIGGGPAGLSAAVYAGRQKLKTLMISKNLGGTAVEAHLIENWLGQIGSGIELMQKFIEHAKKFGAEFAVTEVKKIEKKDKFFVISTSEEEYQAKSLIIGTGMEHRKLGVPGEAEFFGRGVSYCYTCDGFLYKDKTVAVIGGANSSCNGALFLSGYAKKVYLIYRKESLRGEKITVEKIENTKNIEVITNANVTQIKGSKNVNSIVLDNGKEIKLDGVFVEIGLAPSTNLVKELGVKMDESGFILSDDYRKTNVAGLFVAGDVCANNVIKQIVSAASDGAVASLSANDYIKKL